MTASTQPSWTCWTSRPPATGPPRSRASTGGSTGWCISWGGWRGGAGIVEADLADWDWLQDRLVRTWLHTSRAFHDAIKASPRGRLVLISTVETRAPSATNALYAAAKAAAETWTLAVADSFKDSAAAAVILQIKALLTPGMRAARPDAAFAGYTPVDELAGTIHDLWLIPAAELNGQRR